MVKRNRPMCKKPSGWKFNREGNQMWQEVKLGNLGGKRECERKNWGKTNDPGRFQFSSNLSDGSATGKHGDNSKVIREDILSSVWSKPTRWDASSMTYSNASFNPLEQYHRSHRNTQTHLLLNISMGTLFPLVNDDMLRGKHLLTPFLFPRNCTWHNCWVGLSGGLLGGP